MKVLKLSAGRFFSLTPNERMQMIGKLRDVIKADDLINTALYDFYDDDDFHQQILDRRLELFKRTGIPDFGMGKELLPLYIIIRILKPDRVVETGVGYGSSTAYILRALQDNEKGILVSIGMPYLFEKRVVTKPAVLVDDDLKTRWEYVEGWTWDNISKFYGDVFLHDSDHCAEYMHWELSKAKKCFKYVLAHDAANNQAFKLVFNDDECRYDILTFENPVLINARNGSLGVAYVNRVNF